MIDSLDNQLGNLVVVKNVSIPKVCHELGTNSVEVIDRPRAVSDEAIWIGAADGRLLVGISLPVGQNLPLRPFGGSPLQHPLAVDERHEVDMRRRVEGYFTVL